MSQIQKCRKQDEDKHRRRRETQVFSPPVKDSLPQAVGDNVDPFDKTPTDSTTSIIDPAKAVEELESFLNDFESFTNSDWIGLDGNLPYQEPSFSSGANTTYNGTSSLELDQTLDKPLLPWLSNDTTPFSYVDPINSSVDRNSSRDTILFAIALSSSETYLRQLGDYPPDTDIPPSNQPLDPCEMGTEDIGWESAKFDASETSPCLEPGTNPVFTRINTTSITMLDLQQQALSAKLSDDPADSKKDTRNPQISTISALTNGLSKCSLKEKSFIEDALEHFSVSTQSSFSSSKHFSASTISSVGSSIYPRLSTTSRPASAIPKVHHQRASSAPEIYLRRRSELLELPGDFITTSVNTFSSHVACIAGIQRISSCLAFCEGCCLANISKLAKAMLCIPFTVLQFKRGHLVENIWSSEGLPSTDTFGNTALHVAAALGAKYYEFQDMIRKGMAVNKVNTAGQTFMHVLDPRQLDREDMLFLRNDLEVRDFKFHQIDVQGKTFLDPLKARGLHPLEFARFWLEPILKRDNQRHVKNYDFVKKLFESSGGTRKQWDTLGWVESWWPDIHPELFRPLDGVASRLSIYELFHSSIDSLKGLSSFTDVEGRSCLHIAADGMAESAPAEMYPQYFKASRLSLVKDLLSVGVEVEHHDKNGETPLMAHIRSMPYQYDVIEIIVIAGANLNARDNKGENALHISVKLGNISATKALLTRRADIHARNRKKLGILAVAKSAQRQAKDDTSLYARIDACMALAIDAGAIASPSLFQEWDTPEDLA